MAAVDIDSAYYEALRLLAAQIPEMAAMLLGIIFSLAKWGKYPRPAFLSFIAFGLMLLVTILFMVIAVLLPAGILMDNAFFAGHEELYFTTIWAVRSFLIAGAYLLLIFAIYAARKPRPPMPPHLPDTRVQEVHG